VPWHRDRRTTGTYWRRTAGTLVGFGKQHRTSQCLLPRAVRDTLLIVACFFSCCFFSDAWETEYQQLIGSSSEYHPVSEWTRRAAPNRHSSRGQPDTSRPMPGLRYSRTPLRCRGKAACFPTGTRCRRGRAAVRCYHRGSRTPRDIRESARRKFGERANVPPTAERFDASEQSQSMPPDSTARKQRRCDAAAAGFVREHGLSFCARERTRVERSSVHLAPIPVHAATPLRAAGRRSLIHRPRTVSAHAARRRGR